MLHSSIMTVKLGLLSDCQLSVLYKKLCTPPNNSKEIFPSNSGVKKVTGRSSMYTPQNVDGCTVRDHGSSVSDTKRALAMYYT